jgi:LPXTG-site transpeptidase (sortase) family protein
MIVRMPAWLNRSRVVFAVVLIAIGSITACAGSPGVVAAGGGTDAIVADAQVASANSTSPPAFTPTPAFTSTPADSAFAETPQSTPHLPTVSSPLAILTFTSPVATPIAPIRIAELVTPAGKIGTATVVSTPPVGSPTPQPVIARVAVPTTPPNVPLPPPTAAVVPTRQPPPIAMIAPVERTGSRIRIPALNIEAPVVTLGVSPDGEMEAPAAPDVVGWYTFSHAPGSGGNAVISGHRDWHTGITGVFFRLSELTAGQPIDVIFGEKTLRYVVEDSVLYPIDHVPLAQIVGVTPTDTLTLITCEGNFNRTTRDYSHRRIVRATLNSNQGN